jgi:hypothetical protein
VISATRLRGLRHVTYKREKLNACRAFKNYVNERGCCDDLGTDGRIALKCILRKRNGFGLNSSGNPRTSGRLFLTQSRNFPQNVWNVLITRRHIDCSMEMTGSNKLERLWKETVLPNLGYYSSICLEKENHENFNHNGQCSEADSKWYQIH